MTIVLITGSRCITNEEYIFSILDKEIKEGDYVIQGGANGVDKISLDWCNAKRKDIIVNISWNTIRPVNNKREYYLHRNAEMIGMCDRVIAIWDGESRGTDFTVRYAKARNKPVTIYNPNEGEQK